MEDEKSGVVARFSVKEADIDACKPGRFTRVS